MQTRTDLRNVAIIAHVDHGKTTLVDAMLRLGSQSHARGEMADRVMDSMDLEREKGITILAKNTAISYQPSEGDAVTINIIDTPGHADFGGEVERGLTMVDGVALLVDASEGPLPQTRFVLRKALHAKLPIILIINKVDRPDARIKEVVDETYELFLDLDADEHQIEFPIVYACARDGIASLTQPKDGTVPEDSTNPEVLSGTISNVRISELLITEGLDRKPAESAGPGDIMAVAGIPEIMIGETLADAENPVPLPLITVDEPAISMVLGTNTSPMVGKVKGSKVTARMVKDRLEKEMVGNVSLRILPTERPDAWEVQGRGELALAILVEQMRRESYELTVGKPQVVTKTIDGKVHEPVERLTIDAPDEYMGAITTLLSTRKGRMEELINHGTGWLRMEWLVPARALIGFRTEFLTETRGTGIMHHLFEAYEPWFGELRTRQNGSLVADRAGVVTAFAMTNLQERGSLFVEPGTEVYEGMIVGENSRMDDMDVNITKEKKLTNMRQSTSDETEKLIPPRKLSLEQALEFCREDECVEVTPSAVRIRKVILDQQTRGRQAARRKHQA